MSTTEEPGYRDARPSVPRVSAARPPSQWTAAAASIGSVAVFPTQPASGERALAGQMSGRGRLRALLSMLGPAFVTAIAYVDPGNFAANFQGGARYGYQLLWVVLLANIMAMPVQFLSAKLGIATDRNLPELVREHYPHAIAWGMWVQAEVVSAATDIAEFLGAALGLNILLGVPMLPAGLIVGVVSFAILTVRDRSHRRFELTIAALLFIIVAGFLYEVLLVGPSVHAAAHGLVPALHGTGSLYISAGIIGATVMPHAVYLHSALTGGRVPCRDDAERRRVLRFELLDVVTALGIAGLVNMAMLALAAELFHTPSLASLRTIPQAYLELGHLAGGTAALVFALALLVSGISSSGVGTYAGQVAMAGFVSLRIPLALRRMITMIPAIAVLALGVDPTRALVLSQIALSFGIPFALAPLIALTSRRDIMRAHANRRATTAAAWAMASLITALDAFVVAQQLPN